MSFILQVARITKRMNPADYILSTSRLGLRLWRETDIAPFAAMNADADVMRYFPSIMTTEQTMAFYERIAATFAERGYGLWAVDMLQTGEFIGFIGFSHPRFDEWFTPCVEIGWRLRSDMWGHGLATEGAAECLHYGFDKLGFRDIYSFTAVQNLPSERVMQKIGMTRLGEFDHPVLAPESPLRRHLLYRITSAEFTQ